MDNDRNATVDGDSDLSFEALTFGDNGNHNESPEKTGARQIPKKKDKFRKKPSKKEGVSTPEGEKSSSVYISAQDEKLDVQAVLSKLEQFGAVRASYFKEKQNFGIVQFVDPSVVDAVIENLNAAELGITVARSAHPKDHAASPHSFGSMPPHTPSATPSTPPPEKPDTILVLKNLPFTLKQDQLHEILLSLSTTIPQSISLHYDNAGVFRGMAFIKYRQLEDAIQVYELLNGMDVGGRKVRVEYKRKNANATTPRGNAPIEIPPEWQEDEELRKLWEQLTQFKDDATLSEWYYPSNLTNNQRRNIYNMCEKLRLYQGSSGDGSGARVQYLTKSQQTQQHPEHHSGSVDSKKGTGMDIKGRRPRRDSDTNVRPAASSPRGVSTSVGRTTDTSKNVASSAPADMNLDWRHNQPSSPVPATPPNNQPILTPVRQPRGPDGSKGFADQYRTGRKLNLHTTCAFLASPTHSAEVAV